MRGGTRRGALASVLKAADAAFGRALAGLAVVVALSIGGFAVAIVLDLFMRRAGVGNLPWLNEVLEYLLYAGVFLAAPWVLRQGAHVRLDVLISSLPSRAAAAWERLLDAAGFTICGVLAYYGVLATLEAWQLGMKQYKTLTIDTWWLLAVFVFATCLLALEFLFRFWRASHDTPPSAAMHREA